MRFVTTDDFSHQNDVQLFKWMDLIIISMSNESSNCVFYTIAHVACNVKY
jgi:hypothetical protein